MGNGRGNLQLLLHAAVVLLTLLGTAAGYCRQGSEWIEHNGSCYHWTRTPTINWFAAELACKKYGGHLVSIGSPNEHNFVRRLTHCLSNFWIGMVNTVTSLHAQVKGYEWWDGTYHNYTALTPNNDNYKDCIYSSSDGKWYNYYCSHTAFGHVCKAPAAKPSVADTSLKRQEQAQDPMVNSTESWSTESRSTATTEAWPETTPSPVKCPSGWQLLDSSCYFVSAGRTNYFNAQMSCQALGASVTSILTMREHSLLIFAIGCSSPLWIGLEKARPCFKQPNKDHCWVWMDRSPVNLFEWAPSQTLDRRDAECVILDGQWKVTNCYAEYGYICKKPAYGEKTSE